MPPSKTSDSFGLTKAVTLPAPAPATDFGLLKAPVGQGPIDFSAAKIRTPAAPVVAGFDATPAGVIYNTITGLQDPKIVLPAAGHVLQGINNQIASYGVSLHDIFTGGKPSGPVDFGKVAGSLSPILGKIVRGFYGDEPVSDVATRLQDAYDHPITQKIAAIFPTDLGVSPDTGKKLNGIKVAMLAVVGGDALNFLGGEESVIKDIVSSASDDVSLSLLKRMGLSDELASKLAPAVTAAKTPEDAHGVIKLIEVSHGGEVLAGNSGAQQGKKTPSETPHSIEPDAIAKTAKDLEQQYAAHQPEFAQKIDSIGKETGFEARVGPAKTAPRIGQKLADEYKGDPAQIRDGNRGVILVKNGAEAKVAIDAIHAKFGGFERPVAGNMDSYPGDYVRYRTNVPTPAGVAEVQVTTPEMWKAKIELGGDKLYHQVRIKEGDWQVAEQKMTKLYADARAAVDKRLASDSEISWPSARALNGGYGLPVDSAIPNTSLEAGSRSTRTIVPSTSKNLGNAGESVIPTHSTTDRAIPQRPQGIRQEVEAGQFPPTTVQSSVGEGVQATPLDEGTMKQVRDLLPAVEQRALSNADKQALIKSITGDVKDPAEAAMSFKEFSRILDQNERGIVDNYNQLLVKKRFAEQALEAHPDNSAMREKLAQMDDEIKTTEDSIKNMRLSGDYLDDVPVVPDHVADAIDSIVNSATVRDSFKDITGFKAYFRDFDRNFEHFFGNYYRDMKDALLNPFDKSKGAMVDEMQKLADELRAGIVDKYGWARASKESAAVQDWGERNFPVKSDNPLASTRNPDSIWHSEEELLKTFGPEKTKEIQEADVWFRKQYGRLIDEINAIRELIYPNNPDKLIKPRVDYYRHFKELGDGISGLLNLFETPSGIDPMLVGTSAFTQPKSKFLPFAQLRTGPRSERDAIGGFLDYIPSFAYAKHIDPHIGSFRYLKRKIASLASVNEKTRLRPDQTTQPRHDNMLTFLMRYADDLAGKTSPVDRVWQEMVPGGRKTFKVLDWANRRVKANSVLGSFGSMVGQLFNLPNGLASVKQYALPGLKRTLASIFVDNAPMGRSTFLKERYQQPIKAQFKLAWLDHPIKKASEDSKNFAAWMLGVTDEVATRFIWNSHLEKALAKGESDPVKWADDMTRRAVAGRGVGEVPIGQKSKIMQLIAPFQIEVQNTVWALRDMISEKDIAGLVVFMIAAHQMNQVYSKLTGNKGTIDPIQSLADGTISLAQEWKQGETLRGIEKFAGRQAGEVLSNVFLGQTLAAMIPSAAKLPGGISKQEFFGQSAAGRYPATPLVASVLRDPLRDPLFKLVLPWGGNQLKKTLEGAGTVAAGRAKNSAGKTEYRVKQTPENYLRAIIFGKSGLPETQKYYDAKDAAAMGVKKTKASGANFGI